MRILFSLLLLGLLIELAPAASTNPIPSFVSSRRRLLTAPELKEAPQEWVERSFQWVDYILQRFPPTLNETPVRRAALTRLDDILHLAAAPELPAVQDFYRLRLERAIAEIEQTRVTNGVRVWKLYNMGFLARTPSVTLAFDVVRGLTDRPTSAFTLPTNTIARLVAQADVLFISHLHGDHADPAVVRLFLDAGKPVLGPEGILSQNPELTARLTYPKRSTNETLVLPLRHGQASVTVLAYPGHQDPEILNNVHRVTTPEGFTLVHTGDQHGAQEPGSDFDWLDHIGEQHPVDILLPNCWTRAPHRLVRGVNPKLVITGHENEIAHSVDHREDYTQTYNHFFQCVCPVLVMSWGESYLYLPRAAAAPSPSARPLPPETDP